MHWQRMRKNGSLETKNRSSGEGTILDTGYIADYNPAHPLARKNGRVLRHRAILYEKIGSAPQPCHWCGVEVVWTKGQKLDKKDNPLIADHKNEDKLDNNPDNLVPSCMECNVRRHHSVFWLRSRVAHFVEDEELDQELQGLLEDVLVYLDRRCV